MEIIGQTAIWTFLSSQKESVRSDNMNIRNDRGHKVRSYMELATKIAELQFRNRDSVLFFRGVGKDYTDPGGTSTQKATLFRPDPKTQSLPTIDELRLRFDKLKRAEGELQNSWHPDAIGEKYVMRYRVLRWAILQHYEICPTPLLDVTHSIRIAASFATLAKRKTAYVFVFGVPNVSGAVTASAESGLQIIRLSSVCPPNAVRPHIQEGYLLGEYPEMNDIEQKQEYPYHEIDFGRRLVAKFSFNPDKFWDNDNFPKVPEEVLYPDVETDPFRITAERIKDALQLQPQ